MLYYKENFEEIMERRTQLQNVENCGALIQIRRIGEMRDRVKYIPMKPLNQWNFDTELYEFMKLSLENAKESWKNRTDVWDDSIPSMAPRFGIAEHSSFMGGEVDYQKDTSYQIPFITMEDDDIEQLRFQPNNKLLNYLLKGLEYLRDKGENKIAVQLRGCEDPGDVANAIRGNDFFMDFYDDPENLQKVFEKCCEGCIQYMNLQKKIVGSFYGGTLTGMSGFLPENSFGHMSVDWTYMCSADFFTQFNKELLIRQIEPYQAALMHIHSGGAHIIPEISSIDKFSYIQLSEDPNQPRTLEIFKKYEQDLKNKFIIAETNFEDVKENLDFLQDKRIQIQVDAQTFEEANQIIKFVKENLPIRKK